MRSSNDNQQFFRLENFDMCLIPDILKGTMNVVEVGYIKKFYGSNLSVQEVCINLENRRKVVIVPEKNSNSFFFPIVGVICNYKSEGTIGIIGFGYIFTSPLKRGDGIYSSLLQKKRDFIG